MTKIKLEVLLWFALILRDRGVLTTCFQSGLRGVLVGIQIFLRCFTQNYTLFSVGIRMKEDEIPIVWPSFPSRVY